MYHERGFGCFVYQPIEGGYDIIDIAGGQYGDVVGGQGFVWVIVDPLAFPPVGYKGSNPVVPWVTEVIDLAIGDPVPVFMYVSIDIDIHADVVWREFIEGRDPWDGVILIVQIDIGIVSVFSGLLVLMFELELTLLQGYWFLIYLKESFQSHLPFALLFSHDVMYIIFYSLQIGLTYKWTPDCSSVHSNL